MLVCLRWFISVRRVAHGPGVRVWEPAHTRKVCWSNVVGASISFWLFRLGSSGGLLIKWLSDPTHCFSLMHWEYSYEWQQRNTWCHSCFLWGCNGPKSVLPTASLFHLETCWQAPGAPVCWWMLRSTNNALCFFELLRDMTSYFTHHLLYPNSFFQHHFNERRERREDLYGGSQWILRTGYLIVLVFCQVCNLGHLFETLCPFLYL